ncbi:MAG: hypothetical protein RBQ91_06750 [Acholeplasma sp.]|nr:hypothetical protein [Acholeplasma sp.]
MKKIALMIMGFLFVFVISGCSNSIKTFNQTIESYEYLSDYILITDRAQIKDGKTFLYEEAILNGLVESGYPIAKDTQINHKKPLNHAFYGSVAYQTTTNNETTYHQIIIQYDYLTKETTVVDTVLTTDQSFCFLGVMDAHLIYALNKKAYIKAIDSDEIVHEFDFLNENVCSNTHLIDDRLVLFKGNAFTIYNFQTKEVHTIDLDESYKYVKFYGQYSLLKNALYGKEEYFHLVNEDYHEQAVFNDYQKAFTHLKSGEIFLEISNTKDSINIGDISLTIEDIKTSLPILKEIDNNDVRNRLNLEILSYQVVSSSKVLITLTNDNTMLQFDSPYQLHFIYDLKGTYEYIGYTIDDDLERVITKQ